MPEMHSDAHLGPGWDPGARRRARAGFIYSQNLAMAADGHALGKRYLCWHHQGDFDVRTLFQANIGEEVNASTFYTGNRLRLRVSGQGECTAGWRVRE